MSKANCETASKLKTKWVDLVNWHGFAKCFEEQFTCSWHAKLDIKKLFAAAGKEDMQESYEAARDKVIWGTDVVL